MDGIREICISSIGDPTKCTPDLSEYFRPSLVARVDVATALLHWEAT